MKTVAAKARIVIYPYLLLHCDGEDESPNFPDSSPYNHIVTAFGAAQVDTAFKKWGTGSALFDGDDDYLRIPYSPQWDLCGRSTDDWSIDFWVKHTDHVGDELYLEHHEDTSNHWQIFHSDSGGGLCFRVKSGGSFIIDTGYGGEIEDTNLHHILLVKVGSKYAIYKDGQQVNYVDDSDTDTFSGYLYIGVTGALGADFDGHVDEIKIIHANIFGANPVVGLTDTIEVPLGPYPYNQVQAKAIILKTATQTVTTKGKIIITGSATIIAKSSIYKISTKAITAKAKIVIWIASTKTGLRVLGRINPPQTFLDEVNKTVRQIARKIEIQWDGVNWIDESAYFVSARANEKLAKTSGEGIASTLDVELDNTTERFTPDNSESPLYGYLKPRVNIRLSIVMGGYALRLFTGYIKNIHPDTRSRICSLDCFDNQTLVYNKRANSIVYEDKRSDQLLETLAGLADLTEEQYEFDIGTHIVNFGYFEDRNVWPIMGEIAVAERGRVFFDRYGVLKFWNRNRLHNRHSDIDLTLNDWIVDLDYSVAEHEIKNAIIVKATPRASAGVQVVWSSGNPEYLNPYTDTLVWIPAGTSQIAWLELEDPCTTFITPIANVDYTANSAQDGSGDNLTGNITIHEFINYGNAVFINVVNRGDVDAYLTKFQVRGNPARILKWIRVTAKDQPSIDFYGRQEFEIENNFIDSEGTAMEIAQEELYRRKEAVNLFRINIVGIPHLLCGDVVNVEHRKSEAAIWDVRYEANVLPDAAIPAWTKTGDATTIEVSPAGYLHIDSSADDSLDYRIVDETIDFSIGATFEARFKLLAGYDKEDWSNYPALILSDSSNVLEVDFATDQIWAGGGGANETYDMDTTDDYHTYRITISGTDYKVYVDGVLRCFGSVSGGGGNWARFQPAALDVEDCETSWDYVYYRTDGAFEPEETFFKEFMIDQLDWTLDDRGFNQRLTLVNPYIFPEIKTIDARGYIVGGLVRISAKSKILGTKGIQTKANIKGGKTKTTQAKAWILS